jgi:alpha-D-xyloside xylohydrolase
MVYRPPLLPYEAYVAEPPPLPVRAAGEGGLGAVVRAEVLTVDAGSVTLRAVTGDGQVLAARISGAGDGVIRVRLSQDPQTRSRSAAAIELMPPQPAGTARIEIGERRLRLSIGPLTAAVDLDPWSLRFLDEDGRTLLAECAAQVDVSGRTRTLPFGRSIVDGAVVAYHESFLAAADEHFVGLGEKFTAFDKRGQRAVMWNYDAFGAESDRSYKNVPFYLSSRGYGLLVDSGTATEFDLSQSTHSCVQIVVPDDLIDYYVLAGPTPAQVLARYARLTGPATLPPKWAFGTWISSGFQIDSQEATLVRARRIREHGLPCDVMHLDCYWQVAGHWSDQRWDAQRFPDPAGMLATLAAQGFRVSLWINPYISRFSPLFAEAERKGYLMRRPDSSTYVADVWHGFQPQCGIVDFTSPEATGWFQNLLRPLLEQGVTLFKTDFGEGIPVDARAANGMTGSALHNVYSLLYNDAVVAVTREVAGHPTVWARASFLGGQRHSAQWSGDSNAGYPAMASTLRGGLSLGLSGIPFWSHDVGGFAGTPSPELYTRWAQFGALSPLVRFHGMTSRLPWDFPDWAQHATLAALRLRYQLMPYIYSAAVEAARTGLPMLRALLVNFPEDPAAWQADLAYLLGPDLLVAPMTDPEGTRHVYLPDGDWIDFWTGTVHKGPRYLRVAKPMEQMPLYVRYGAVIAVTEVRDTVGDGPFSPVNLVSWGAATAAATIHDVDDDTSVRTLRQGDAFELRTEGPAVVRRLAFAAVDGAVAPTVVAINGVPARLTTVDGQLVAVVD